jgi:hypothetical protein
LRANSTAQGPITEWARMKETNNNNNDNNNNNNRDSKRKKEKFCFPHLPSWFFATDFTLRHARRSHWFCEMEPLSVQFLSFTFQFTDWPALMKTTNISFLPNDITVELRTASGAKWRCPCNRPWRPIWLQEVEAPTFSRQLAHRWRWGCQPYAPASHLSPRKIPGTHFCCRLSGPQGHSTAGRIMSIEKSNDLIGIRIRDHATCRLVPRPTTLPREIHPEICKV